MKKTYIIPETLVVALNTKTSILQGSMKVHSESDAQTAGTKDVLTKENKNVWDEEW